MRDKILMLGIALLWDGLLGEPPRRAHPVVAMGKLIESAQRWTLDGRDEAEQRRRGVIMALSVPLASALAGSALLRGLRSIGKAPFLLGGALLLKSTFSVRMMKDSVEPIASALEAGDLTGARGTLSGIVSRGVGELDESQVASAAISSVAENVTDSITGPMLAYGLLGLFGALAYRAVNTLDAMVGYRDHRRHAGRAAAKLDDSVNFLPGRVAGITVVGASALHNACGPVRGEMDTRGAWDTMWRQHGLTESPNGGWPIGAMAGALGVEVEKVGHYRLGPRGRRPDSYDLRRSLRLLGGAAAISSGMAVGLIAARHILSRKGASGRQAAGRRG